MLQFCYKLLKSFRYFFIEELGTKNRSRWKRDRLSTYKCCRVARAGCGPAAAGCWVGYSSSSPFTVSCRAPLYYVQQSSLVLCKVKFFFLFSMSLVTRIRKFTFYTPVLPDCPSTVLFSYVSCNAYSMPCYTYAGFFLVYLVVSFSLFLANRFHSGCEFLFLYIDKLLSPDIVLKFDIM